MSVIMRVVMGVVVVDIQMPVLSAVISSSIALNNLKRGSRCCKEPLLAATQWVTKPPERRDRSMILSLFSLRRIHFCPEQQRILG
jgi:hypothetical protein